MNLEIQLILLFRLISREGNLTSTSSKESNTKDLNESVNTLSSTISDTATTAVSTSSSSDNKNHNFDVDPIIVMVIVFVFTHFSYELYRSARHFATPYKSNGKITQIERKDVDFLLDVFEAISTRSRLRSDSGVQKKWVNNVNISEADVRQLVKQLNNNLGTGERDEAGDARIIHQKTGQDTTIIREQARLVFNMMADRDIRSFNSIIEQLRSAYLIPVIRLETPDGKEIENIQPRPSIFHIFACTKNSETMIELLNHREILYTTKKAPRDEWNDVKRNSYVNKTGLQFQEVEKEEEEGV